MSPLKGQRLVPETHRRKNQVNVRLTDWEMETLKDIADEQGISVSFLVRQALGLFFQRYQSQRVDVPASER